MLAFAVLRAVLNFVTRVLLSRVAIPLIVADVLVTLGLIVFALYRLSVIGVGVSFGHWRNLPSFVGNNGGPACQRTPLKTTASGGNSTWIFPAARKILP